MSTIPGECRIGCVCRTICPIDCLVFSNFQQTLYNFLEESPIFSQSLDELTLDEKRKLSVRRQNQVLNEQFITLTDVSLPFSHFPEHLTKTL